MDYLMSEEFTVDPVWSQLNTKGFSYGLHGFDNVYEQSSTKVTNRFPGFISSYSLLNVAEDKAEVFSRMMLNLHEMECRAKDDAILGKKMDRLKLLVKEFSADVDDQFWQKIRYLNRPRLTPVGKEDPWAVAHPALPRLVEPVVVNCHLATRRTLLCHRLRRCCR